MLRLTSWTIRLLCCTAILSLTGLPSPQLLRAQAQDPQQKQEGHYWKDMPLDQVLKMVREKTGKNFLFADSAFKNQPITFMSNKTLETPEEWFAVFESILQLRNYALVKIGDPPNEIYKIMPSGVQITTAANLHTEVIVGDEKFKPEDKMIIRLFIVKYVSSLELYQALAQTMAVGGAARIQHIQSARAVMVRDYDYNIAMLEKLVKMIDVELPDIQFEVRRLQYANARDAATMLDTLMRTISLRGSRPGGAVGGQLEQPPTIVPDLRTNSLLILAEHNRMPKILELIKEIDTTITEATSGIFMYTLKHTKADEVAKTLNSLYSRTSTIPSAAPNPVPNVQPAVPGGTPAALQTAPIIVPDVATNAIIVVSERSTYKTLENIIKQLDRRKPQVLIRATVVEVASRDSFNLGVELAAVAEPANNPRGFAGTAFGLSRIDLTDPNNPVRTPDPSAQGLTFGIFKDKHGRIPALLQALQTKGMINVLSEPEALTNDNTKAILTVRDSRPYTKVNTVANAGSTVTDFDFKNADTTMTITPRINEGSYLSLDTKVTVQQFGLSLPASGNTVPPPPVISRELETSVTVPDGRTIVIGGLVSSDDTDTQTGVPFAMDIPILGQAFKKTSRDKNTKTLYLFITPHIVYDEQFGDIAQLTRERQADLERLRGEPLKLYVDYRGGPVPSTSFQYKMPVRRKKD